MVHMVHFWDSLGYEVVLVLLGGGRHLRDVSKEIGVPHSTVMRCLNGLVEGNVLDFRFEGRNKVFFLRNTLEARSYVFNAERYKLLSTVEKYPFLGVLFEEVLDETDSRLVVLFGSYAKGNAKKDSDVDLYVETKDRKLAEKLTSIDSRINLKIGLFDPDSLLIKEIVKNHVILRGVEDFYEKTNFFKRLEGGRKTWISGAFGRNSRLIP